MTLSRQAATEIARQGTAPVLATRRLILRTPRLDDAEEIATLVNDRRIAENTARIPHPYARTDAESFIASVSDTANEAAFVITLPGGAILGVCGIHSLLGDVPDVGYWLGAPYWGRGYATEAARAVIDHAFADLGCDRLEGGARVSNPASRRVLEKCGFQWTGVRLTRIRALASSAPVDRFRLDRRLWASLRNWGKLKRVG